MVTSNQLSESSCACTLVGADSVGTLGAMSLFAYSGGWFGNNFRLIFIGT